MDHLHDGHRVWLQSRHHGSYLHADEDGRGVSLSSHRASMNAAWVVHRHHGVDPRVLLHSAAYGRYLAVTGASAPLGCRGFRVEQRPYVEREEDAITWEPEETGPENDILLRHAAGNLYGYLRANGKHLRWNDNVVSVEHSDRIITIYLDARQDNVSTMMQWMVVPIPTRESVPRLPRPNRLRLHLAESFAALLPSRVVVLMGNAGGLYTNLVSFVFRGSSVFCLRNEVARRLGMIDLPDNLVMYVRAGEFGLFTPLVVNLPSSRQNLVITVDRPAYAAPGYPDIDAV